MSHTPPTPGPSSGPSSGQLTGPSSGQLTPEQQRQVAKDLFATWEADHAAMKQRSQNVDWSKFDFSKLNPKDLGVQFGPPMDEHQFAEYRKNRTNVTVVNPKGTPQKKKT